MLGTIPTRIAAIFALVAAAQLLDLATFMRAVERVGIGAESNPLARSLYVAIGPMGPAVLKLATIGLLLMVLTWAVRRFPAYSIASGGLMVAIGLVGSASNLLFGLLR